MSAATKRRIFLTDDEINYYKLFSISQNENDGSIYLSWPLIENTNWIIPNFDDSNVYIIHNQGDGKISFHGSGQSHFKSEDKKQFAVHGHMLQNIKDKEYGARHLLTICHKKIELFNGQSPAKHRKTDFILKTKNIIPMNIMLFAIPKRKMEVEINLSLSINDLENIPHDIMGLGNFPMKTHEILWVAYRTKFLKSWPPINIATFSDGYVVPLYIKENNENLGIEFVKPEYALEDDKLRIKIKSSRK